MQVPHEATCGTTTRILGGQINKKSDFEFLQCYEETFGDQSDVGNFIGVYGWSTVETDDGSRVKGLSVGNVLDAARETKGVAYFHKPFGSIKWIKYLAYHEIAHMFDTLDSTPCSATPHKWYHINSFSSAIDRHASCKWWGNHLDPWLAGADVTRANSAYSEWVSEN